MANINVSYEDMSAAAGKLNNGMQEIDSQLRALQAEVNNLVNGGFVTDQASKAFAAAYEEFNNGCTQVIGGLEGMSSYLTKASGAMSDMDSQLAQAIQR